MQDATRVMSQGLVVIEDGVIIQCNDSFARMLGVPQPMLATGQSWHASFAYCAKRGDFGDEPMAVLRDWQEKVRSGKGFSSTFLSDGKTWIQMEATASGRGHWMVVCTDITDIKSREEELKVLLARSEAADKAKSGVPRQHEPRDPHADERRARHGRTACQVSARYPPEDLRRHHRQVGQRAADHHQRHPRLLEDRCRTAQVA